MRNLALLYGRPTVGHIHVKGEVNCRMTEVVTHALLVARRKRFNSIVLTIDSEGGSGAQAAIISERVKTDDQLKEFCDKRSIPLYVVAGQRCLSAAYMILATADKSFCDPSSVVGGVGSTGNIINASRFIKNLGVDPILVTTDQ